MSRNDVTSIEGFRSIRSRPLAASRSSGLTTCTRPGSRPKPVLVARASSSPGISVRISGLVPLGPVALGGRRERLLGVLDRALHLDLAAHEPAELTLLVARQREGASLRVLDLPALRPGHRGLARRSGRSLLRVGRVAVLVVRRGARRGGGPLVAVAVGVVGARLTLGRDAGRARRLVAIVVARHALGCGGLVGRAIGVGALAVRILLPGRADGPGLARALPVAGGVVHRAIVLHDHLVAHVVTLGVIRPLAGGGCRAVAFGLVLAFEQAVKRRHVAVGRHRTDSATTDPASAPEPDGHAHGDRGHGAGVRRHRPAGYWSVECWGGATFDACIRFLNEDPWERLRTFRKLMPNSRLQMLLRGQNLLGYRHYEDTVVDRFVEKAAENGMDVFRVFDALNDVRNVRRAIEAVKRTGKHAQGTICYTISPLHTVANFVDMAQRARGDGLRLASASRTWPPCSSPSPPTTSSRASRRPAATTCGARARARHHRRDDGQPDEGHRGRRRLRRHRDQLDEPRARAQPDREPGRDARGHRLHHAPRHGAACSRSSDTSPRSGPATRSSCRTSPASRPRSSTARSPAA
jgi:hypothetical protein